MRFGKLQRIFVGFGMNQGCLRRQLPGRKPSLLAQRLWRSSSADHGLAPIRPEGAAVYGLRNHGKVIVRAMISARVATSAGFAFLCSCLVLSSSFSILCCFCVTLSLSHYTPFFSVVVCVCVFACSLLDIVGFWLWVHVVSCK